MSKEMNDSTRYEQSKSAVATTWIVSFKQISAQNPDAADILHFMSCIEWKAIPHSILSIAQSKCVIPEVEFSAIKR